MRAHTDPPDGRDSRVVTTSPDVATLTQLLQADDIRQPAECLRRLLDAGADQIPLPGQGHTLGRWRLLAAVAAHDLALAKLYEGHTDALAIMAELGCPAPQPQQCWAVWCAEPPTQRLQVQAQAPSAQIKAGCSVRLHGSKPWCSGADVVDHALLSGWLPDGQRCLVAVSMPQAQIEFKRQAWQAVGMAGSASVGLEFDGAMGVLVGAPGAYLSRPGFVHGGAGVAACWYGAACTLAQALRQAAAQSDEAHRLAHLGAIDVALAGAAALLREAARDIDRRPADACIWAVSRARLGVEAAVQEVLIRVPRAIGPGPFCHDAVLARMLADLPVFIRQSHAERDQAQLGRRLAQQGDVPAWAL